ncbi:MAG: T9SS type A sorting domain-containing protein [Candidatus Eisenbacteria bacterium]|uniref:T9SS type A sorting domain-containing protein n=1 Tax=Eiseniibacteriota bacterium TaxID=2212470 RepID=A0A948RX70_UNCEI|nr:T9SS type A sorting domain-containing protein [Candidatus Eisenbacteria bacterium]MBU1949056.1 T9SS type A sorting domain-containing protein [Candidatus Eisenbacteria bacterium]MBU2692690.1 T9SS type A sorting domain-containing protein [Candidatus Eisenbacteria bacterium]
MTTSEKKYQLIRFASAFTLCLLIWSTSVYGGISVSISPGTTSVQPNDEFTVYLSIDEAGSEFDSYETVIEYDETLIELLSASQEALMLDPCGNTWWVPPTPGADSAFISHVLLCGGLTVTGPGNLSSLTFRALQNANAEITFDYIYFWIAGELVPDIVSHDGLVIIGGAGAVNDIDGFTGLKLDVSPNPAQSGLRLTMDMQERGAIDLTLYDPAGRKVSALAQGRFLEAGQHELAFHSRDLPAHISQGLYFVVLRTKTEQIVRKVMLIP